jgi:Uma2 family endonuclease
MSTGTIPYPDLIAQLPEDSTLILRNVSWDDYETLLEALGEARGLRLFYDEGTLQVMTLSSEHESYTRLIERFVDRLSAKLRIEILFFGASTMKRKDRRKGTEPDACFYVETARVIGRKIHIDFATDPPPDVVVEIDLSHDSLPKFPLYSVLGVPEIWRYDGSALTMYRLEDQHYVSVSSSAALPFLDARTLTNFLGLSSQKNQHEIVSAFEEWLDSLPR